LPLSTGGDHSQNGPAAVGFEAFSPCDDAQIHDLFTEILVCSPSPSPSSALSLAGDQTFPSEMITDDSNILDTLDGDKVNQFEIQRLLDLLPPLVEPESSLWGNSIGVY
jgi:hypothetical protein